MGISLKNLTGAIDPTKKQEDDDKIDDQFLMRKNQLR